MAHNQPLELEHAVVRPSGERRHVFVRGEVVHDGAGRPAGLRGICLDVTRQKQIEEALERQAALVGLLNRITAAANEASTVEHALRECVNEVRDHMGFGIAGFLMPRALGRAWVGPDGSSKSVNVIIRAFAIRDLALGLGAYMITSWAIRSPRWTL